MTPEQKTILQTVVKEYFWANAKDFGSAPVNGETVKQVIETGCDILALKWQLTAYGNTFVKAVIKDSLNETFASADSINVNFIRFYVLLKNNIGMPSNLL